MSPTAAMASQQPRPAPAWRLRATTVMMAVVSAGMVLSSCRQIVVADCPAQQVHVGNLVEVGGRARHIALVRGEVRASVPAFVWGGRTVAVASALNGTDANAPLELQELNGTLIRRILPVAHNVSGLPGQFTLGLFDRLSAFADEEAAPTDPTAASAYQQAQESLAVVVPALRALVVQARAETVEVGSYSAGLPIPLDQNQLSALDRILTAAQEPIVPLVCESPTSGYSAGTLALASTARLDLLNSASALLIAAYATTPEVLVPQLSTNGAPLLLAMAAPTVALKLSAMSAPTDAVDLSAVHARLLAAVQEGRDDLIHVGDAASLRTLSRMEADFVSASTSATSALEQLLPSPAPTSQVKARTVCNSALSAGLDPAASTFEMGSTAGTFEFTFHTGDEADQLQVLSHGAVLFDTGCTTGSGSRRLSFSAGSELTVNVTSCAGGSAANWTYSVGCPL